MSLSLDDCLNKLSDICVTQIDFYCSKSALSKRVNMIFEQIFQCVSQCQILILREYKKSLNFDKINLEVRNAQVECINFITGQLSEGSYTGKLTSLSEEKAPYIKTIINSIIGKIIAFITNSIIPAETPKRDSNALFLVHGNSVGIKNKYYSELSKYFSVKILDYQRNASESILDKLIRESENVSKAVILLCKDDFVKDKTKREYKQPRPNVFIELGYFVGILGKKNVVLVRQDGANIPSDIEGIGYISTSPFDLSITKILKEFGVKTKDN